MSVVFCCFVVVIVGVCCVCVCVVCVCVCVRVCACSVQQTISSLSCPQATIREIFSCPVITLVARTLNP